MDWELCLNSLQYNTSLYNQWTGTVLLLGYSVNTSVVNTVFLVDFKIIQKRSSTAHPNLNQIMIVVN
jgi:hypothetical protein